MGSAEHPVSFILLHQGRAPSLDEMAAALPCDGIPHNECFHVRDLIDENDFGCGPFDATESALASETVRRLHVFVSPNEFLNYLAPLLLRALWGKRRETSVILAYEGLSSEHLLLSSRMLQAGSDAVLFRSDQQHTAVLALASNYRNRKMVQHWADCVTQFCLTPYSQDGDLELDLGSSLVGHLCDNVTTLRRSGTFSSVRDTYWAGAADWEKGRLLRSVVRKVMPTIPALQVNPGSNLIGALNLPSSEVEQQPGLIVTNLMRGIWQERQDLQIAFDLRVAEGRRKFIEWFLTRGKIEYDLRDHFLSPAQKDQSVAVVFTEKPPLLSPVSRPKINDLARGLNLVGYPRAEMGMGEQLRSCADSLCTVNVPFAINDFNVGIIASHAERRYENLCQADNPYPVNLFHINADQLPLVRERLGASFFRDHYNIGYWEWELSCFPESWMTSIDMVDEIWAPSRFIHQAVSAKTQKPVVWMPLAVDFQAPAKPQSRGEARTQFGLPERAYLFLFSFDFSSFSTRKNYRACLDAFRKAFPGNEDAGLVLKTIRHPHHKHEFWEMLREIGEDPRIHVLDTVLRKPAMRMLIDVCDCFVSLHRSEGFGLSIAEAMYLAKPVIATNYSGNVDFTRRENSFPVDYRLIPVKSGEYVHAENQVWADPDVSQASRFMRRLFENPEEGLRIGHIASDFIKKEHNSRVIGRRYAERLNQILAARQTLSPPSLWSDTRSDKVNGIQRAGHLVRKFF